MPEMERNRERWFVLKVAPQHEAAVHGYLGAKGFDALVPTCKVRRRWSDRVKTLTLPLFPGYVFCRFAVDARVPVMNTPGVRGAVCFGAELAALEDDEVERIERMAASGLALEPLAGLRAGSEVRIIDGPLNGMSGVLAQINGAARLVVNVEILNRSVAVQVDREAIAPARDLLLSIPA